MLYALRLSVHLDSIPDIMRDNKYIQGSIEQGKEEIPHTHIICDIEYKKFINFLKYKFKVKGNEEYSLKLVRTEPLAVNYAIKEGIIYNNLYSELQLSEFKNYVDKKLSFTQRIINSYQPNLDKYSDEKQLMINHIIDYYIENAKIFDEYIIYKTLNLLYATKHPARIKSQMRAKLLVLDEKNNIAY